MQPCRSPHGFRYNPAMSGRWLIRTAFAAVACIFIVVWIGSYWREVELWLPKTRIWVHVSAGLLYVDNSNPAPGSWGFASDWSRPEINEIWTTGYPAMRYHFAGFAFDPRRHADVWQLYVPLWFPGLTTISLLWLAWRKTRAPRRGFRIETIQLADATATPQTAAPAAETPSPADAPSPTPRSASS